MRRLTLAAGLTFAVPRLALAQDVSLSGMLDLRLAAPSGEPATTDGGLGKVRWGEARAPVMPEMGQALLRGSVLLTPDLRIVAEARYDPQQKTVLDLVSAYARYRPVSTTPWRFGVKAGAFFPPVSLENGNLGWTTDWTLTPSAINSWVGEELRTLGVEATAEWRGEIDHLELVAALYGLNEPAGAAIKAFGWTFTDRVTGLFDHVRMPGLFGQPAYSHEFKQLDHAVGWYAGVTWDRPDIGRISLLRYDNEADPRAHDATDFAWRTRFWSLSGSTQLGPVVVLTQGMVGSTIFEPSPGFVSRTDFWSWYVLAGIEQGAWRYAIRFDQFGTGETNPSSGPKANERGVAATAAVTWTPRQGISVTGEVLAIDYARTQRRLIGKTPHATEVQAQLALRFWF